MNYYQHNIGDYKRDTAHLSLLEHGIYRQLLDLYYLREAPLDANALRLICARTAEEKTTTQNILDEFFKKTEKGYIHKRCQAEMDRIYEKSDKARANAKARWDANAMQTHSERNADAMLPNNPLPNNPLPKLTTLSDKSDTPSLNGKIHTPQAVEVLNFLNEKTGRAYRPVKANLEMITARLKEGATVQDCKTVIARKSRDWVDDKMKPYLRPATLFNRTKFAQYIGECV